LLGARWAIAARGKEIAAWLAAEPYNLLLAVGQSVSTSRWRHGVGTDCVTVADRGLWANGVPVVTDSVPPAVRTMCGFSLASLLTLRGRSPLILSRYSGERRSESRLRLERAAL